MYLFHNDYNEICHPVVMERLQSLSGMSMPGYGLDACCESAAAKIRQLCGNENATVHFLVGGTQTNLTVIAAALRPYQGVLGAQTAHVNVHETGAIEATGHKVIALPSADGKIAANQVEQIMQAHLADPDAEHTVQPKLVYISDSTELGTVYTLAELEALHAVCKQYGLYLFVDGARLSYALAATGGDVTLQDLARLCDVFYMGGTKCGTMIGEAVVITNPQIDRDFRYMIKQRGAMLAKGWILGAQFDAILENNLYFSVAAKANTQADRIRSTISELGYRLQVPGNTNQIFPILPNFLLDKLAPDFTFVRMDKVDEEHTVVRFCTSWATSEEAVDALCEALRKNS